VKTVPLLAKHAPSSAQASPLRLRPRPQLAGPRAVAAASPALDLRIELELALLAPSFEERAEPTITPWPAPVRLLVILGGAATCWATVVAAGLALVSG
jgi:hypothetical protein